jgi:hypothetical protein
MELLKDTPEVIHVGEVVVRGKTEPVQIYRLDSSHEQAFRVARFL